jgi:hypothetical protein
MDTLLDIYRNIISTINIDDLITIGTGILVSFLVSLLLIIILALIFEF